MSKLAFRSTLFAILLMGLVISASRSPVEFNQFLIQRIQLQSGIEWSRTLGLYALTTAAAAGNRLWSDPRSELPAFDDSVAVFDYVFSWVPLYAVVYPTEGFYYWNTHLAVGDVSGNIRIADLDKGKISFAYFTVPGKLTHFKDITIADGLKVNKRDPATYDVTWRGKTVRFVLAHSPAEPFSSPITLQTDEELVGQIVDESAVRLWLIYNHTTDSFYEILDEQSGLTERLVPLDDQHLIGIRTGFVFFADAMSERKILVAVDTKNTEANNYLDGPADQVPFWLDIKEKINVAYPNTLLGDGTDSHGVYLNRNEWMRIAISPYHRYREVSEVIERSALCQDNASDRSYFWTCLTKEWWNTQTWRQGIFDQLRAEGKPVPVAS